MSRVITSPVKKWPGTVTLADPLSYPQVFAFQDALDAARAAGDDVLRGNAAWLPGVLACVERWELEGLENVTVETFPATPVGPASRLVAWLVTEISRAFSEAEDIPNA